MKRFNKVLYKLIISYIIIIALISGIIGGVSYYFFSRNYENQIAALHEKILLSVKNDLRNNVFSRVTRMYSTLWFGGILSANLYLSENGTTGEDLTLISDTHSYMKNEVYFLNSDIVSGIHLYYKENNIIVSTSLGVKFLNDNTNKIYTELDWVKAADDTNFSYAWMLTEKSRNGVSNPTKDFLTYVQAYPYISENISKVIVALDIEVETLEKMIDKTIPDDYEDVFLVDSDGYVLVHENKTKLNTKIDFFDELNDYNKNGYGFFIPPDSDDKRIILYCNIPETGWKLVSVVPLVSYYKSMYGIRNLVAVVSFSAIFAGLLLALIFSSTFYNPIKTITANIKKFISSSDGDEHLIIQNAVKNMVNKFEEMEHILKLNEPIIKREFINALIFEEISDKEKLMENLALLKIDIEEEYFFCIVISLSQRKFLKASLEERQYIRLKIVEELERYDSEIRIIAATNIGDKRIAVICGAREDSEYIQAEIEGMCCGISEYVKAHFGIKPTIAVGSGCNELYLVGKSYKEASAIRKYDYFFPERIALKSAEFIEREASQKAVPLDMMKDFQEALNLRKHGEISASLKKIIDEICNGPYNISNCHAYLLGILHTLSIYVKNIQFIATDEKKNILNSKFEEINDVYSLEKWILSYWDEIFIFLDSRENSKVSDLIRRIKEDISQNLSDDISLDALADRHNLSSKYLSRLFKEETGENFVDYITNERMSAAAKLLEETDLSIEETGIKVGYRTSAYFIKKFKAAYGETPNNYRKKIK